MMEESRERNGARLAGDTEESSSPKTAMPVDSSTAVNRAVPSGIRDGRLELQKESSRKIGRSRFGNEEGEG